MQDRRSERLPTSIKGTYRTPRGFECAVDVDDLSLGGCRVDDLRGGLMLGEYVQVTLGGAGPFVAEVAWRQSARVGLQFTRALPAHIVKDVTGMGASAQAESAPDASPDPGSELSAPAIPQPYHTPDPSAVPTQKTEHQRGALRRFV